MNICIGSACESPAFCKGMCRSHYARAYKYGDARLNIPIGGIPKRRGRPLCEIDGCEKDSHAQGLCSTHYARLLRSGSVDDPLVLVGCSSPEGCDRPHNARGLCTTHYSRLFKRRGYLKYTYRMTEDDWETLFVSQGRRCLVCLTETTRGDSSWHTHHDHRCCPGNRSCGRCVIGILCGPCNVGMGSLGDDPERLERAAALMRRVRHDEAVLSE